MILKSYTALSGTDDSTDTGDSSWWDKAMQAANSSAASKIIDLFGGHSSSSGSYTPRPAASSSSPWLWVGGGLVGVVALSLLLRRR